jgi:hypothetical protein
MTVEIDELLHYAVALFDLQRKAVFQRSEQISRHRSIIIPAFLLQSNQYVLLSTDNLRAEANCSLRLVKAALDDDALHLNSPGGLPRGYALAISDASMGQSQRAPIFIVRQIIFLSQTVLLRNRLAPSGQQLV